MNAKESVCDQRSEWICLTEEGEKKKKIKKKIRMNKIND